MWWYFVCSTGQKWHDFLQSCSQTTYQLYQPWAITCTLQLVEVVSLGLNCRLHTGYTPCVSFLSWIRDFICFNLCLTEFWAVVGHRKVTVTLVFTCRPWPADQPLTWPGLQNSIPFTGTVCPACTVVWCLHLKVLLCLDSGTHGHAMFSRVLIAYT